MYVKGQPFIPQFFDPSTGERMASGTVEFYLYDTNTPTPYYTNSTGTSGGTSLTLGSGGKPSTDIFFDSDIVYKIVVKNAAGTTLDTIKPYYPVDSLGSVRASGEFVKEFDTMAAAIASATLVVGDVLLIKDRASSTWDVVLSSGVTENGYNIVQGVGVPTVSFVLRIENRVYNPVAFGAPVDNSTDAYGAIAATITKAYADFGAGSNGGLTLDFGDYRYKASAAIDIPGINFLTIRGNWRITSTHSDDYVLKITNASYLKIIGMPSVYGAGGATYADRTNLFCVIFHHCSRMEGSIYTESSKADGIRFTGTSSQPVTSYIGSRYAGSGYPSASCPTSTFTAPVQTGSVDSTGQRSTLTMSAVPQQLKDYIDYGNNEGGHNAYIVVNDHIHEIRSYSGNDIVVWPWVDPADAGQETNWVFGASVYMAGIDVSIATIGEIDVRVCGIGLVAASLYPPAIMTSHMSSALMGIVIGNDLFGAAEETFIGKAYFEDSVTYQIVMGSQVNTYLSVSTCVNAQPSKWKQLWSNNGASVPAQTQLSTLKIAFAGREYSSKYMYQVASSNQQSCRMYEPEDVHIIANTGALLIVDDDDFYDVFGQRAKHVYWYSNTNGMTPTGSMTFTPPTGGTINGKAPDATQVFNTATGPQHFIVSRSAALTYFIEPLAPSTVTKV